MKDFIRVNFRSWKRLGNASFTLGLFKGKNVSQMAIKKKDWENITLKVFSGRYSFFWRSMSRTLLQFHKLADSVQVWFIQTKSKSFMSKKIHRWVMQCITTFVKYLGQWLKRSKSPLKKPCRRVPAWLWMANQGFCWYPLRINFEKF